MTGLNLTPEMIAAINRVAKRKGNSPMTVLKRAIFTYTGRFEEPAAPKPGTSNVVSLRREER
jgi:hypothetical protein